MFINMLLSFFSKLMEVVVGFVFLMETKEVAHLERLTTNTQHNIKIIFF